MATLTVRSTTNYSLTLLSGIDTIDFTNSLLFNPVATATFGGSQFDNVHIEEDVHVDGSSGFNNMVVNVAGFFAANLWTFTNWLANDSVTIIGQAGNDTLGGSSQRDAIHAGGGNDNLNGNGGNDILNGGDGDDQIFVQDGEGADRIDGGAGTDFLYLRRLGSAMDLSLNLGFPPGGGGSDIGDGTTVANIERLTFEGGSGNDRVGGGSFNDILRGGSGADTLSGLSGEDALDGGDGDDNLSGWSGNDTLTGAAGNDALRGDQGNDVLNGGDGDDSMVASASGGADTIDGGPGTDFLALSRELFAAALNVDLTLGGEGFNIGDGTTIANIERIGFRGGTGNDRITGGALADALSGGGGNDLMDGGSGNDTLLGGDGDDTINSGNTEGPDTVDGGGGTDLAVISRASFATSLTVNITSGGDGADIGDGTTIAGIERLNFTGGSGSDAITGGALGDRLLGGDGHDTISGAGGDDLLAGGDGDDTLIGGDGNDTLDGRGGVNMLNAGDGDDRIESWEDGPGSIATIDGGSGADILFLDLHRWLGGAFFNIAAGGGGADIGDGTTVANIERLDFAGGSGNDTITGGALGDFLRGRGGNDILRGRAGTDVLIGGLGRDTLAGGAGSDVFLYEAVDESPRGSGRDNITDFRQGIDRIAFNGLIATTFIGTDPFGGEAGEFRYVKNAAKNFTVVALDSDGDLTADLQIRFAGLVNFTAADFDLL